MTDCSLLREGPNGLFHWAHIVRSDKDFQDFPYLSWNDSNENSRLKIANLSGRHKLEFLMHSHLSLSSALSEIVCIWRHGGQEYTPYTGGQNLEENIVRVLCWFWCINSFQIAASICKWRKLHTLLFHCHTVVPLAGACSLSSWWWWSQSGMHPPVSTDQQNWKHSSTSPTHLHILQLKLDSYL